MSLINSISPIFLLIFFGWLLRYKKIVSTDIAQQLTQYVFWIASPAVIFNSISSYQLSDLLAWRFTLAHIILIATIATITFFITFFLFNSKPLEAIMMGMMTSAKNTIMIGLPLLISLTGNRAAIPVAITVIIFNIILTPFLMLILEISQIENSDRPNHQIIANVFYSLVKNPLIVAAIIGIFFSISQLKLPLILNGLINYIVPSFIPCALFAVGVDLYTFNLGKNRLKLYLISFLSLLICPLIAIFIAYLMKLSVFYATSLIVLASLPTAKSLYVYARKYHFHEAEIAAIISLSTVLSVLTIPIFIVLSLSLW